MPFADRLAPQIEFVGRDLQQRWIAQGTTERNVVIHMGRWRLALQCFAQRGSLRFRAVDE